jgi:hypothetical protein
MQAAALPATAAPVLAPQATAAPVLAPQATVAPVLALQVTVAPVLAPQVTAAPVLALQVTAATVLVLQVTAATVLAPYLIKTGWTNLPTPLLRICIASSRTTSVNISNPLETASSAPASATKKQQ